MCLKGGNMKILKVLTLIIALSFLTIACSSGGGSAVDTKSNPHSPPTSSITLSWNTPTENTDGSPYTDSSGYRVYYNQGTDPNNFTTQYNFSDSAFINRAYTESTISNLTVGTSWCFAVTAVDTSGNESNLSTVICATIS